MSATGNTQKNEQPVDGMLPEFETLAVSMDEHVAMIALNRPDKANAMNPVMWRELQLALSGRTLSLKCARSFCLAMASTSVPGWIWICFHRRAFKAMTLRGVRRAFARKCW